MMWVLDRRNLDTAICDSEFEFGIILGNWTRVGLGQIVGANAKWIFINIYTQNVNLCITWETKNAWQWFWITDLSTLQKWLFLTAQNIFVIPLKPIWKTWGATSDLQGKIPRGNSWVWCLISICKFLLQKWLTIDNDHV